jgi:hypothetical protein
LLLEERTPAEVLQSKHGSLLAYWYRCGDKRTDPCLKRMRKAGVLAERRGGHGPAQTETYKHSIHSDEPSFREMRDVSRSRVQ